MSGHKIRSLLQQRGTLGYEDADQAQRSSYDNRTFLNSTLGVTAYPDPSDNPALALLGITQTTSVVREATGQMVSLTQPSGATSYPLTDALGSVVGLTNSDGARTDTFTYDPYGDDDGRTGTTPNPFQFTGEYHDPSGLYKIGLRQYQPATGRWTQPDPLLRSTNPGSPPEASPYIYVGNNPVNYTDPSGAVSCTQLTFDLILGATITLAAAIFTLVYSPTVLGAIAGATFFVGGVYLTSQTARAIRDQGCLENQGG